MRKLGYEQFYVVGHDRGARVGHRLALDYPAATEKFISLDVVPIRKIFASVDRVTAEAYFHWSLMLQPKPLAKTYLSST